MIPIPWSQRTFDYGRSLDELPVLLERVQGTTARLSNLLARQPLEKLLRGVDGKWSAMEHLGHLLTLQDRFASRVDDFEQRRPKLCDIDLRDQDPFIQGQRSRSPGDVLEEFRLKRIEFAKRLEHLHHRSLLHAAYHPCQDRTMRPMDMLLWIAEHDDHHLASVRALLDGPMTLPRPSFLPD